ncbi:MAG: hypothetical protein LBS33_08920 [Streptococcaceae bacterium]|jgi:flagellar basal body-associated protein FliL|nr:hypothetical protein [Streptococcaceae bacterium]
MKKKISIIVAAIVVILAIAVAINMTSAKAAPKGEHLSPKSGQTKQKQDKMADDEMKDMPCCKDK